MTKTNLYERAQVALYGATTPTARTPETSAPAAPVSRFDQHGQHAERLYGSKYSHAVESFHARFEAKHREDREALDKSREARAQHQKFFTRLNMDEKDVLTGLGRVMEYEALPRSAEDQEKVAQRTIETLRLELGSTEKAQEVLKDYQRFLGAYREDVPYIAERATRHGAPMDLELVRIGARYGANLPPIEQSK